MICLILAAGNGRRLAQICDSKPLVQIAGMPLIEHPIATAQQAGVTDFYVVTGHASDQVEDFLSELSHRRRVSITPIRNPEWELGNGLSLLAGRRQLHEPFLLLMADHILDKGILDLLLDQPLNDGEVILAADFGIDENQLVDLDDVTKVLTADQQIVKIGKELSVYNAFDTGAFLCSPRIFGVVEESVKDGDRSVSGAIRLLAVRGKAKVIDVQDYRWLDVDTPQDLRNADRLLVQNLSKPTDGS